MSRAVPAALALVTAGTLALRTGVIHTGYWIDEAITVGIASHPLGQIPAALRLDGSPPLFYLLLHGWMAIVGSGEAATRALALVFALLAVPVAWWAGSALFGLRAGALAAAGAAGCPFLTYYAQETRMYSLVAVLSMLASASFVLGFVRGRRRFLWALGASMVLLLYTHNWALFLAAGMAAAWLWLWRAGRVEARDGALVAGGVALLYAPWVPSLAFQAANTAAPWAERPGLSQLLGIPGTLFGSIAGPLLVVAAIAAVRRGRVPDAVPLLVLIALVAAGAAFLSSQLQPAWAPRYAAVLFGPLGLALAAVLARGPAWTWAALAGVVVLWLGSGPAPAKSNVRTVSAGVAPALRAGDLGVCTQPDQVPALVRYLPAGVRFLTPLGAVREPEMVDWRDGVARLRAGTAERVLAPVVRRLGSGRRLLLVVPLYRRRMSQAPWSREVRARTDEWSAWIRRDRALRPLTPRPRPPARPPGRSVSAQLFAVR